MLGCVDEPFVHLPVRELPTALEELLAQGATTAVVVENDPHDVENLLARDAECVCPAGEELGIGVDGEAVVLHPGKAEVLHAGAPLLGRGELLDEEPADIREFVLLLVGLPLHDMLVLGLLEELLGKPVETQGFC